MHELYTAIHATQFPLTYSFNRTQASGAKFDMVMSTKEQETFETALSARDGFESIKAGLTRVDVRKVQTPPWLLPRALAVITPAVPQGPEPPLSPRLAGRVPQHRGQEPDPARAGAGRGLRRVQQAGRRLDA